MRSLSLVLTDQFENILTTIHGYPSIPPAGHVFTLKDGNRRSPYRVIETQSIIDVREERDRSQEEASNEPAREAVRVEVERVGIH
jgi:hypothetical protein